jgi:D-threo-aldose 1-dehydrogenase
VRDVLIPAIGRRIPVLGFGCSALTGTSRKIADRLLQTAFDSGIRHFDVARYYGYGEAEGILGTFLRSRRVEVTITTKFGIQPPRRSSALGFAVRAGRRVLRLLPSARKMVQARTQGLVRGGAFRVEDARSSLETSLRELSTEHIEFYLLHDYVVDDQPADELVAFLDGAVKAGKVRRFGIATGIENVLRALKSQPRLCDVLQFENSAVKQNIDRLPIGATTNRIVITHGAVGQSHREVSAFLSAHRDRAKEWSETIGADCSQASTISALLLNYAVQANPGGLVLFSSMKPENVARNAKAVFDPEFSSAQIALFAQLVRQMLAAQFQSEPQRLMPG